MFSSHTHTHTHTHVHTYSYANQQGFDCGRLTDGCAMIVVNGDIRAQGTQFSVCDIDIVIAKRESTQ